MTTRREFISRSGTCAAHLALAASLPPELLRRWIAPSIGTVVAREPFGALEKVTDNVWALISNPLGGDRTTLCNGGLIAGRNVVLAIEGFNQPSGAAWLADKARELTGRFPTHVLVTHYHGDHSNGVAGYVTDNRRPAFRATTTTRDLILTKNPANEQRADALKEVDLLANAPATMDLGGITVRFIPRDGHTASDVTIEIEEPSIVFCGDLMWNRMVPNYVDAVPSALSKSVRALQRTRPTTYVPGHGALANATDYTNYIGVIDEIEKAARKGKEAGQSAADAAKAFKLPPSLGEWTLFSPQYFERAIGAWYKEL